jgi:hypothetical protein
MCMAASVPPPLEMNRGTNRLPAPLHRGVKGVKLHPLTTVQIYITSAVVQT